MGAQDPEFKVLSVISSSFFWPYPHMRTTAFRLDDPLLTPKDHPNEYRVGKASPMFSEDTLARLNFRPDDLTITYYDRKGGQLGEPVKRKFYSGFGLCVRVPVRGHRTVDSQKISLMCPRQGTPNGANHVL